MKNFAITITRTCGSGGTTISKMIAEDLKIDLYDRKLLMLAAEDSGINERLFAAADEDTKKSLLYKVSKRVFDGSLIPPEICISGKSIAGTHKRRIFCCDRKRRRCGT